MNTTTSINQSNKNFGCQKKRHAPYHTGNKSVKKPKTNWTADTLRH